ncbi:MAG: hypothetical protein NTW12_08905 [Deltaproteobacteria bacterium]|nr:hypothetical protein [Deltaproteobacteria bacterium]
MPCEVRFHFRNQFWHLIFNFLESILRLLGIFSVATPICIFRCEIVTCGTSSGTNQERYEI